MDFISAVDLFIFFRILAVFRARPVHNVECFALSDDEDNTSIQSDDTMINESSGSVFGGEFFKPKTLQYLDYAPIKNGDFVEISSIDGNDGINIYIRSVKNDPAFVKLLKDINAPTKQKRLDITSLKKDEIVLVKFEGDYVRAAVVDEHKLTMKLIDIGLEVDVKSEDIQSIPFNSFAEKIMVTPVRLKLPKNITADEITAVIDYMKKLKHKRFILDGSEQIFPYAIVDLLHITSGQSILAKCMEQLEKRMFVEDIPRKQINLENVDIYIVDNKYLSKGFVTCVLSMDIGIFASQTQALTEYGQSQLLGLAPYVPDHLELCLVLHPDEEGTPLWYRAQYQQQLSNDRAQVGLLDFGVSATVDAANIRKFNGRFAHELVSIVGKLRNESISFDLLDLTQFGNFMIITAESIRFLGGERHEVFISEQYFEIDENYEEEILQIEDILG